MGNDGFLGRWSKRKLDAKEGTVSEPDSGANAVVPARPAILDTQSTAADPPAGPAALDSGQRRNDGPPVAPTLDDVRALTAESDFKRFAARDVAPEVKNAAMKKLFSDPRYNVMDGLDVYTGDYSQPDPIPPAMLRQLASAKFLGLFAEEEKEEAAQRARDVADNPTQQSVAQSEPVPQAVPEPPQHADPDLRLQQDHAAPGEDPGAGTG